MVICDVSCEFYRIIAVLYSNVRLALNHSEQEAKLKWEKIKNTKTGRKYNILSTLSSFFNLCACVELTCGFCKCIVFIQVLQLSVSAPLVADFPVGHKCPIMLLKVLRLHMRRRKRNTRLKLSSSSLHVLHRTAHHFLFTSTSRGHKREKKANTNNHKNKHNNHVWLFILGTAPCSEPCVVLSLLNPLKVEQTTDELCCV